MSESQFLKDRVAVVTGASSGIGRALATELSKAGAKVVLASRNVPALESLSKEITSRGGQSLVVRADVTQAADVDGLIQRTLDAWGQIDLLVTSSGLYVRGPVANLTLADFQRSMDVNFYGVLRPVLGALPHMLKRRSGQIVVMHTLDGRQGLPHEGAYVAAKHALTGFAAVLRQELRDTGIAVTVVFPGRVDTPMIASLRVPWISPKLSPASVARATMGGIRRRDPEVIVPAHGIALLYVNLLSPRLADWCVRTFHLQGWWQESPDA